MRNCAPAPATVHRVKVWPGLAAAALLGKSDRVLRLWSLARELDRAGRGMVLVAELAAHVADVSGLGGRWSVNRLLDAGDGVYWQRDRSRLWLAGLGGLCAALGVERISCPVAVSLPSKLKGWRSLLCFVGFAGDKWRVCSQRKLAEATGRTTRTVRHWRKTSSWLLTRYNAVPLRAWKRGDPVPEGCYVDKLDGAGLVLFKCLPNAYMAPGLVVAGRGCVRSVNRRLCSPADLRAGGQRPRRLFFTDRKAANMARALERLGEGQTVFLDLGVSNRSGAHLWQERSCYNGRLYGAKISY